MTLKDCLQHLESLRFVTDNLEILSGPGRHALMSQPFMTDNRQIDSSFAISDKFDAIAGDPSYRDALAIIALRLMQLKDITPTLRRLESGEVLDDIALFEVKHFAIIASEIRTAWLTVASDAVAIDDTEAVVATLDPERSRVDGFYIYERYDERLSHLRREMKRARAAEDTARAAEIDDACSTIENEVRERLSSLLRPAAEMLLRTSTALGALDLGLARASFNIKYNMCRPRRAEKITEYRDMVNPRVAEVLEDKGKRFQPVSIWFGECPTVITGSNMAGKSVVLKTVGLNQALFQLGFGVAAESASIVPVDEIIFTIGDEQSELSGLSSYASEMLRLNEMASKVKQGVRPLVLVDEPARTTNPVEGGAIVAALLSFLSKYSVRSLITTHYGGIVAEVRRLRVRGFDPQASTANVTINNLNSHIDYTLTEDDGSDVPHEALRIARILGVDEEIVGAAEQLLE